MLRFFRKHETDDEIKFRLLNLCEEGDYGICPPPMKAEVAINELRDFFLGKDWYCSFASERKPSISEIVYQIKRKKVAGSFKRIKYIRFPLMDANTAINQLCDFFLGGEWYIALPLAHEQIITEIVYQIETRNKHLKA